MKRLFLLLPVLLFSANILFAQDDELPPPSSKPQPSTQPSTQPATPDQVQGFSKPKKIDLSKFIIEPDFNFGIATGVINVGVSPYVGYNVWKDLYVGGGITYLYTGYSGLPATNSLGQPGTANAHMNTYGAGVFGQYTIWKGIFARAKFELLHRDMDDINQEPIQINPPLGSSYYYPKIQVTMPDLLLGVGYNLLRSKNFFFPIIVSYNVLYSVTNTTYSIYPHGFVVQLGFVNVF